MIWKRGHNYLELNKMVIFYNTGEVEAFTFESLISIPILTEGFSCVVGELRPYQSVTFHRNGVLKEAFIYSACKLRYTDGKIWPVERQKILFTENGLAKDFN